jgi:hypothetical protein
MFESDEFLSCMTYWHYFKSTLKPEEPDLKVGGELCLIYGIPASIKYSICNNKLGMISIYK